jgi:hypothetical protein
MQDYDIKISELNRITPNPPFTEDFFPLVHSQSMTTYKATLQDIGSLMTHSIYADTASYVNSAVIATVSSSISASYAKTASYAISASHALIADSASWYPSQVFQPSSLYASRSHDAYYATHALDVDTHGPQYNFPYWTGNTPGLGNGNLRTDSPLVFYPYGGTDSGLLTVDSASTNLISYYPYPNHRPDFQAWRFNDRANVAWGFANNWGIQTAWPIISHTFNGTDQRDWYFVTSSTPHVGFDPDLQVTNSYFSGSAGDASSGSFYTIPEAPGALASIFNGKWVRFVSNGGNPAFGEDSYAGGKATADHSAMGEVWGLPDQIMKGLISIQLQTGYSNTWNQVDLWVHVGDWAGNQSATVLHVNNYGYQHIRAFRLSGKAGGLTDPLFSIDMLIDGIWGIGDGGGQGEGSITIKAQSWQGIRFLKWLNVDPWPFQNTGSNDITKDETQLIFPAAPGYYSNSPTSMNYYVQGKNVVICPTYNQITQSGLAVPANASPYPLSVSGSINASTAYYCNNSMGLTTTTTAANNLQFKGGILTGTTPTTIRGGPTFINGINILHLAWSGYPAQGIGAGSYTYSATLPPGTTAILVSVQVSYLGTIYQSPGSLTVNSYPLLAWGAQYDSNGYTAGGQGCVPVYNGQIVMNVSADVQSLDAYLIGYY